MPDDLSSSRGGIFKKTSSDGSMRVSFHETAVVGTLEPVTENHLSSSDNPPDVVENNVEGPTCHVTIPSIEIDDDSVFANNNHPQSPSPNPRIQITSENNDVFFVGDMNELLDAGNPKVYARSVSDQGSDGESLNTNMNAMARSTSDTQINGQSSLGRPKSNSFLKWFHRNRGSGSTSRLEPGQKETKERWSPVRLLPFHHHSRCHSDSGRDDTSNTTNTLQSRDPLPKVKSDTVIYSEKSAAVKKSWFLKLGGKKVAKSDSHIIDKRKPRLIHYPSVERLDRLPSKSKNRKHKKKAKDLSSYTDETWVGLNLEPTVDDSDNPEQSILNRS